MRYKPSSELQTPLQCQALWLKIRLRPLFVFLFISHPLSNTPSNDAPHQYSSFSSIILSPSSILLTLSSIFHPSSSILHPPSFILPPPFFLLPPFCIFHLTSSFLPLYAYLSRNSHQTLTMFPLLIPSFKQSNQLLHSTLYQIPSFTHYKSAFHFDPQSLLLIPSFFFFPTSSSFPPLPTFVFFLPPFHFLQTTS